MRLLVGRNRTRENLARPPVRAMAKPQQKHEPHNGPGVCRFLPEQAKISKNPGNRQHALPQNPKRRSTGYFARDLWILAGRAPRKSDVAAHRSPGRRCPPYNIVIMRGRKTSIPNEKNCVWSRPPLGKG